MFHVFAFDGSSWAYVNQAEARVKAESVAKRTRRPVAVYRDMELLYQLFPD